MTTFEKTNLNEEMKICWGNNFLTLLGFESIQQWIPWNIVWAHHKICTPMTMSISNRLCMHDLYLVKLQTYLLLIFVITNLISSDNHYFFEVEFPLFSQVTSFLIDLDKTSIFKYLEKNDSHFNKIYFY